ncbi:helix-turn-helix transcriptional regulator [Ketogulonicigenium vulgare]|uniref:helix-turn-helix transcriptional regulator n=1 Tax=Ketogulonicigenium vulgare TaxID=92945 RepID=UPI002359570A|nr:HTH domain-containing protein [Ketogulonicigenium vulgare]
MPSPRNQRLFQIMQILRSAPCGALLSAHDIATQTGVSDRTIYRDMATLIDSGLPVAGTPGQGYHITAAITLPPLNLSLDEIEALHIGLSILGEADDIGLRAAAQSLSNKVDAALSADLSDADRRWALSGPGVNAAVAEAARGFHFLPVLRSAIARRQKLRLSLSTSASPPSERIVRPLRIDYWGRIWSLQCWCETTGGMEQLRTDHIDSVNVLPQLFTPPPQ